LFLFLFALTFLLTLDLILERRIPGGHDGFRYFALKYVFLNNAANSGDIPQWMPFLTHGTVATWWYAVQGGMLLNGLLLAGQGLREFSFIALAHMDVFVHECFLLIGMWLLCRRFFVSPLSIYFTVTAAIGSAIWFTQPWWNLQFYFAVPLILHLVHSFLEKSQWRYIALAANLLAVQTLGGLPYFLPVTTFVIFVYLFFYCLLNVDRVRPQVAALKWGYAFWISAAGISVSLGLAYAVLNTDTDLIVSYAPGRNSDGTVSQSQFLAYGANSSAAPWLELILGASPSLDYSLYIGVLSLPLIFLGMIYRSGRRYMHFYLTALVLLLFCSGTTISRIAYHWPFMNYFRHLFLTCVFVKLFLCIQAGLGLDALIENHGRDRFNAVLFFLCGAMLLLGLTLLFLSEHPMLAAQLVMTMFSDGLYELKEILNPETTQDILIRTSIFSFLSSALMGLFCFAQVHSMRNGLLITLVGLSTVDMAVYTYTESRLRTFSLTDDLHRMFHFADVPYAPRRDATFWTGSSREQILRVLPITEGSTDWTLHAFAGRDVLGSPFRTDHWLRPFDRYLKSYWGQNLDDAGARPAGIVAHERSLDLPGPVSGTLIAARIHDRLLQFPDTHPAALKLSGSRQDKIQFFSEAIFVNDEQTTARLITDGRYRGDVLFVFDPQQPPRLMPEADLDLSHHLAQNFRIHPDYTVTRFDANSLRLRVTMPPGSGGWLFYSDVWHPKWEAVAIEDGRRLKIYRAILAYKAVQVEPGKSEIEFRFHSNRMAGLHLIFGINSVLWLAAGILLFRRFQSTAQ